MVRDVPDPEEIGDNVVIDTPVLDRLQQTSMPFRGQRREELLKRVRYRIKKRRTSQAVAGRITNATVDTLIESIRDEANMVTEERVQEFLDSRLRD